MIFKKASRSGAGAKDVRISKKDWLDDNTRLRKTKSNLDDTGETQSQASGK